MDHETDFYMITQNQEQPIFSDDDRLRMLQLLTRKNMAERRARSTKADEDNPSFLDEDQLDTSDIEIPNKWRLVSENIRLHEWQRKCLPLWLNKGHGTIKVATGGGKTLFALAVAQQLQHEREPDLRLVVVVPTIPLMYQWQDELSHGNMPKEAIALMGGGQKPLISEDMRILLCVLASARDQLNEFIKKANWSDRLLLVVDECHRANANEARRIFETHPKYTLGLSATPEQDQDSEDVPSNEAYEQSPVGKGLGPIIYDFTLKQSLDAGLLTPFEVWHVGLPMDPSEMVEYNRLSLDISELRKDLQIRFRQSNSKQGFLAWCQTQASRGGAVQGDAKRFIGLANNRKRLLYRTKSRVSITLGILADSVTDPEGRAIVFHESIRDIEELFLQANRLGLPAVLEHSQLPDSLRAENIDAFRKGIAQVIISAKSLVEGFNVPSADLGIIAASSSSVRQRIQSLGRMLRRKSADRSARIMVLYIKDTEDEAIYQKADWENVIGAERNRYFQWQPVSGDQPWADGLTETKNPPRIFRPSSWDIDTKTMQSCDVYPGQTSGLELRVDQDGNLRTEDGRLVKARKEMVEIILTQNPLRRARRTPAGHLIVRIDARKRGSEKWLYLGQIEVPQDTSTNKIIKLKLVQSAGRREIALGEKGARSMIRFALGPGRSPTPAGGQARNALLSWISAVEQKQGIQVKQLFWDEGTTYWIEVQGERITPDAPISPLEFAI